MTKALSPRLLAIVDALPLRPGLRVLEVGCGPGAAAREIARRLGDGHVLAIDRSAKAIAQARAACADEIASGRLSLRQVAAEDFSLEPGEAPFDLAFAIRVGALDGRRPEAGNRARERIAAALKPKGRLFVDGGAPLRDLALGEERARLGIGSDRAELSAGGFRKRSITASSASPRNWGEEGKKRKETPDGQPV